MKINLSHKEANLLNAILWELGEERSTVLGTDVWRLTDVGADLCHAISQKLEVANDQSNASTGKERDLSGSPKGTISEARWSA